MAYECVLKCGMACNSTDTISQHKWDSLQLKSKAWTGLDRFGGVHDTTSWENGPVRYHSSTVVLTVVRVMIAKYRKSGIWGYRSSLTPEPIELK